MSIVVKPIIKKFTSSGIKSVLKLGGSKFQKQWISFSRRAFSKGPLRKNIIFSLKRKIKPIFKKGIFKKRGLKSKGKGKDKDFPDIEIDITNFFGTTKVEPEIGTFLKSVNIGNA